MQNVLMEGLNTALIGIIGVFLGLLLLIGVINLMRAFGIKDKPTAPKSAPAPVAPPAKEEEEDDGAVVAAVSAAIAMVLGQEGKTDGFVVKRIRRIGARW